MIRPATVLYALDIEHVFQHEEEHVVVRYDHNAAPICECIPVSRIAGMRKEELEIE